MLQRMAVLQRILYVTIKGGGMKPVGDGYMKSIGGRLRRQAKAKTKRGSL